MRIAVCRPQVAFVRGGVEIFTDALVAELRARGHEADLVTVPWQPWPNDRLLTNVLQWRLLDLERDAEVNADLVIATKFPSYVIRHPNKVVWLVHQLRAAYELHGTEFGQFSDSVADTAIRRRIQRIDRDTLAEARKLFATSANVAGRLRSSTALEAAVLPHPPQDLDYRCSAYEPFVLSVGRLDPAKRVDLLIEAAAGEPRLEIVVVGEGPDRERLERLCAERSLNGRVRFAGRVSDRVLVDFYARCRAVYYAPLDEDFGMVPFEAFRSCKPVVTTTDAGGPLEIVRDGETGCVAAPAGDAVGAALRELLEQEQRARDYGQAGRRLAQEVTWERAIAALLG